MRAAVLREYGEPLDVADVPAPDPDPEGIVVDLEACGVCRSDWHAWQGHGDWINARPPRGHVLGHEPAGVVAATGDEVATVAEGDRVAIPFNLGCGTCEQCRRGRSNVCAHVRALGFHPETPGAFAEAVHVPDAEFNAVRLPDGLDPAAMASLGCRFMTAFHALAHRAGVTGGDRVAVHGCGGVGLSAVAVADALGASVVAVDVRDSKLDRARSLGAAHAVNARDTDVVSAVMGATDGGADVSVDALGVAETARNSVRSLRRRGTHVQVGLTTDAEGGEVPLPTDLLVVKELSVVGAYGMPPVRYPELLRLVTEGRVDPGALVSERIALDDVTDRLRAMTDYETEGIPVVTEFG